MAHGLCCRHNTAKNTRTGAAGAAQCVEVCHGNMGTAISHSANGGVFPAG